MKKIMITGATGLLGRGLNKILSAKFNTLPVGFSRSSQGIHKLDLTDFATVTDYLKDHQPDILIHAAAERKPDICENNHEQVIKFNIEASRNLAQLCKELNIWFVLVSTDYVFDGTKPPYKESAEVNPLNFYGQSKSAAEEIILAVSKLHSVIRVPVLYGDVEYLAESAITVIAEQINNSATCSLDHWAIRYPTHVEDIALTLADMINKLTPESRGGIFHLSADTAYTKYETALIFAQLLNINDNNFIAVDSDTGSTARPKNCHLQDTRLKPLNINHQRDFKTSLKYIISHLNK